MSDRVEQAFSRLRRGPWYTDPLAVPQQGDGGIESQGWLADDSVTADVIQANAVIAGKIDADAVTAREIAANTITAAEIAANTITASQIAANTITASQIAANTITATEIASNAITADEIAANTITAAEIAAGTITATEIAADAITTSELAANAVITENVLAANITSSRIELSITGKTFGANDGTASAPGLFFDSASNYGFYRNASTPTIVTAGSASMTFGATTHSSGDLRPRTDNTYGLGNTSLRWTDVWAADGTINTSDARLKTDIVDSALGLDFVKSLRPVSYRWRDTSDTQAKHEVDEAALARECRPHEAKIQRIRARQLAGRIGDEEANEQVAAARAALDEIHGRHVGNALASYGKRRPGKRPHYGLIAQEVKAALDVAGVDAAFWKETPGGEQALAYSELIAPLIKAVQEQDATITEQGTIIADLTDRLAALENR